MYNRYIRNDRGTYTRIPEADTPPPKPHHPGYQTDSHLHQSVPQAEQASQPCAALPSETAGSVARTLRRLLDRFHLDSIDSGDLLLLLLLFLLFREDADEELLFALGLLLIL